jgi:hypothetical protein
LLAVSSPPPETAWSAAALAVTQSIATWSARSAEPSTAERLA